LQAALREMEGRLENQACGIVELFRKIPVRYQEPLNTVKTFENLPLAS